MSKPKIELSQHPFLLAKALRITSLKRRRKVWAFLPSDYFENLEKRYPVIYFNDGQNVFESWKAAFGESWEIHNTMRELGTRRNECILIGIEHGNKHRIGEYSPFKSDGSFAKEGNDYADFMANKLKNYVDTHLRTKSQREYTFIAGSSMGGLMALYTAFKHQDVYAKAGVFSPSLWIAPAVYDLINRVGRHYHTSFYLSAGSKEGASTVNNLKHLNRILLSKNFETRLNLIPGGQHNEKLWREEFRNFYLWL